MVSLKRKRKRSLLVLILPTLFAIIRFGFSAESLPVPPEPLLLDYKGLVAIILSSLANNYFIYSGSSASTVPFHAIS